MKAALSIVSSTSNAVFAFVAIPIYLGVLGAESYAIIALFNLIMAFASVLDTTLSQVLMRESSKLREKIITRKIFLKTFAGISVIMIAIYVLIWPMSIFWEEYRGEKLLHQNIEVEDVRERVLLLFYLIIGFRVFSGLLRGVALGLEGINFVSSLAIFVSINRFLTAAFFITFYSWSLEQFFLWQLIVSTFEFSAYALFGAKSVLSFGGESDLKCADSIVKTSEIVKFTIQILIPTAVWIIITQGDKAILANTLNSVEFSYFTSAYLLTSFILIINGGLSVFVTPRLVNLHDRGNEKEFFKFYHNISKVSSIINSYILLMLLSNAEGLLYLWTKNTDLTDYGSIVVKLYGLGNFFLILAGVPYTIQFAKQKLDLHVKGNYLFLLLYFPLMVIIVPRYSVWGAGALWVAINFIWLIFWCKIIHSRYLDRSHSDWLFYGLLKPITPNFAIISIWEIFEYFFQINYVTSLIMSMLLLAMTSLFSFTKYQSLRVKDL